MLGVETDFDGTTLSKVAEHHRADVRRTGFAPGFNDFFTLNSSIKLDWLGTTRARVGFVATPDNRLMIYGTGGVAYGGGSAHLSVFDATNGFFFDSGSHSATRAGWTIGGGVEYAVDQQ